MTNRIKYEDYSDKVLNKMDNIIIAWLYEAAGEVQSQTQRNSRVDTGQTKSSWKYTVDTVKKEATIGSAAENAVWEEFGTGLYALNGDGRKTAWFYKDRRGNGHITRGKHPQRMFHNAYESLKNKLPERLRKKIKELSK